MSEFLVGAVEATAKTFGMTEVFVGVILVAIIGNAAEHSTAILMALKNKMDIAVNIAVGSSIQIALFVAPLLVFLSYAIGPQPMDLRFTSFEVLAIVLSVFIIGFISQDGESNWMEGVQLLAVYAILGLAFYFLPAGAGRLTRDVRAPDRKPWDTTRRAYVLIGFAGFRTLRGGTLPMPGSLSAGGRKSSPTTSPNRLSSMPSSKPASAPSTPSSEN